MAQLCETPLACCVPRHWWSVAGVECHIHGEQEDNACRLSEAGFDMQEDHGIVLSEFSVAKVWSKVAAIPKGALLLLIKFYRLAISPLLPATCRFIPTCSEYGLIAVQRFGFLKGLYLTCRRILRCRPGGGRGYDPVPDTFHL